MIAEHNREVLATKKFKAFDCRAVRPDGTVRWIHVTGEVYTDDAGVPVRIIGTVQDITEHRQAEQALHLTRFTVDSVADAVYWMDSEARIVDVNETACRMLGYTRQELLNLSVSDIDPAFSIDQWPETWKHIKKAGKLTVETKHQTKDGQIIPVEVIANYIEFGGRELDCAVVRDITERKRVEAELRTSEARYRALVESQIDLISRYLPDTTLTFVNDAYCQFFGKTREELIGHSYLFMIAPEFRELVRKETEELAKNPRPLAGEYLNYRHDGKECWIQWVIQCIADENGRVVELQAVGRDITERKQAEEALEKSEERLRLALEATADGIWDWDPRTGQAYFSPRYYTMMGYEPDEFPSTYDSWQQLLHSDDAEAAEKTVQQALAEHTPFAIEFRFKAKNGDWRWILSRGKIVELDAAGKAVRVAGSHTDITDRKQVEAEIRRLNEELEQRVHDRTAQLEAANKELEAFSYSVSHDLRAPLRAIDGYTRILVEDYEPSLDAEGRRVCGVIRDQTRQMGQLIDDLLAFSRLSRISMQASLIDMEMLVNSVFHELTTPEERERIDFQRGSLPPAVGDPALIRQVWTNLLSNAIKFSAKQTQAVINVGSGQDDGVTSYYVRDNGVGFDMQYADKLFGVFQRLHSNREFEGTGVGLAIIQRIIHRHGGRVWAKAEVDRGATFYFTLPERGN
jgi:PAS domain S-box-containing protein